MKNDTATRPAAQKTLANLQPNECRWPIGDPQRPGFHFCGAHKQEGNPYCAEHAALAVTPSRPRPATYRPVGG
ncbi:MAG TPA: GcrA family cell cycle regulator [Hyphomicrobium sp.]|nr:GcrA family cell cycle regulator [Hyphomicrobium sp.]